jgi:2-amino-4-hydroxy-6-hydroxymethyldihydropteridine diphosphokinase
MKRVFVSLGGNIGDVKNTLLSALQTIAKLEKVKNFQVSRLYYTSPVGVKDQPHFYNCVAGFDYEGLPQALLYDLQAIEGRHGRVRLTPHGPRTCDLDILLFGDDRVQEKELSIPHPRMYERLFVLIPLLELLPGDERIRASIKNLQKTGSATVEPVSDTTWESLCIL